jgi:hypothetical protein
MTFLDIATLSFPEQVAMMYHNVDILIGFHGAGMNHMFHMNRGREGCCGVIELFPQRGQCSAELQNGKLSPIPPISMISSIRSFF